MEIESFFPGRIRVSSPMFKREQVVSEIRKTLIDREGIKEITGNARTGSLTVTYDALVISMEDLLLAKEQLEILEQEHRG